MISSDKPDEPPTGDDRAKSSDSGASPHDFAWARAEFIRRGLPFTEEELERLMANEAGLPLEDFIAELERAAQGP